MSTSRDSIDVFSRFRCVLFASSAAWHFSPQRPESFEYAEWQAVARTFRAGSTTMECVTLCVLDMETSMHELRSKDEHTMHVLVGITSEDGSTLSQPFA